MPWFAGVKREEITWYPTIDYSKCVKCGICMNCGRGVYAWTEENKPVVVNPDACIVGCSTCANLCLGEAIAFPPLANLRSFYKAHKIWSKVKATLISEGKLPKLSRDNRSLEDIIGVKGSKKDE